MNLSPKIVGGSLLVLSALLMVACSSITVKCTVRSDGTADCSAEGKIPLQQQRGAQRNTFDAGLVSVDLSGSSAPINSVSGYATITLKLLDGTSVANSFAWTRFGDELVLSNPATVNAWVNGWYNDIDEADVSWDFEAGSNPGSNTVVVETVYDGSIQSGAVTSWYVNGSGCGLGSCQQE